MKIHEDAEHMQTFENHESLDEIKHDATNHNQSETVIKI